jgi:hypothetical protein
MLNFQKGPDFFFEVVFTRTSEQPGTVMQKHLIYKPGPLSEVHYGIPEV